MTNEYHIAGIFDVLKDWFRFNVANCYNIIVIVVIWLLFQLFLFHIDNCIYYKTPNIGLIKSSVEGFTVLKRDKERSAPERSILKISVPERSIYQYDTEHLPT